MRTALALVIGAALLAAACGGGDDPEQQEQVQAPAASAVQEQEQQSQPAAAAEPAAASQTAADASGDDEEPQAAAQPAEQESEPVLQPAGTPRASREELAVNPRLELLDDAGYPVYLVGDYVVSLGTPDLGVGTHRVTIAIEGPEGLVETPTATIAAHPPGGGEPVTAVAEFARFPDEVRGFHVARMRFDRPGDWTLEIDAAEGGPILLSVPIAEATRAPDVGAAAPPSLNRTLADVEDVADLSTGFEVDALLYTLTVADALANDLPTIVVFASPGFCTNAFCGPQAEVLTEIRIDRPGEANYIHVDLYENPVEVRLGEPPQHTPLLEEWGLETDEWTFVLDAEGVVRARFEAFAPRAEVEAALDAVLAGS